MRFDSSFLLNERCIVLYSFLSVMF